ncbi:tubulin domain-containing protein [Blyttiomyces helicus]|uniref:Tubulin domain-containing protein n=1 Tax=Blyttiomyces helicus TaxID=388810 RepID=A0A4P9VY53_9FUNG|nr:tubulin domain-containing protein [Blyttiomyces helicus]|eukprot:RKO83228.1 tubulin domain-containing protein [Blyttiomyces helicus]
MQALGDEDDGPPHRQGAVERHEEEPFAKNQFLQHLDSEAPPAATDTPVTFSQDLDSTVQVWTDFNKIYHHPRTIVELTQFQHADETNPFALYSQGRRVFADQETRDEVIENRIRFFAEESDSLQGFNVIADVADGFAGFTADLLEYVSDDYAKKAIFTHGIHWSPENEEDRILYAANSALAMKSIAENSSIYVPLYPPKRSDMDSLGWSKFYASDLSSPYRWSAYLASAIETASLPWRTKSSPTLLSDLASAVTGGSTRKIAALSVACPFPIARHGQIQSALGSVKLGGRIPWMRDLTLQMGYDEVGLAVTFGVGRWGFRATATEEYGYCAVLRGVTGLSYVEPDSER